MTTQEDYDLIRQGKHKIVICKEKIRYWEDKKTEAELRIKEWQEKLERETRNA